MSINRKYLVFVIAIIAFSANAYAQSPREQLSKLVTQLQSNPGDTALRERIIKLAQEIKPPPAVPEEVERRLGRGQAAFEVAREPADFDKAVAEFTAASNEAPWLGAAYYNMGVALEKAKKYREAMASFRLYTLASPGASDASEIRQRIFKLEYLAEQGASVAHDISRKFVGTYKPDWPGTAHLLPSGRPMEYWRIDVVDEKLNIYQSRQMNYYQGRGEVEVSIDANVPRFVMVVDGANLRGRFYRNATPGFSCPSEEGDARGQVTDQGRRIELSFTYRHMTADRGGCATGSYERKVRLVRE